MSIDYLPTCLSKCSLRAIVTIIILEIFILLSRVDVVFLFWSLIPVFPRIQTVAHVFYSQNNFIGSYFLYSPRRQVFFN